MVLLTARKNFIQTCLCQQMTTSFGYFPLALYSLPPIIFYVTLFLPCSFPYCPHPPNLLLHNTNPPTVTTHTGFEIPGAQRLGLIEEVMVLSLTEEEGGRMKKRESVVQQG